MNTLRSAPSLAALIVVSGLGTAALAAEPEADADVDVDAEPTKSRMYVPGFQAEDGVKESTARLLSNLLLAELSEYFETFGSQDLKTLLEQEHTEQMVGCNDVSCLAEVGGAVGADLIVAGSVGAVGELYVVTINVVSSKRAQVETRYSSSVQGGQDVLVAEVKKGVASIAQHFGFEVKVAEAPAPYVSPPPPAAEVDGEDEPLYTKWWLWTIVGVVLVGGGVGAGVGVALSGDSGGGGSGGGGGSRRGVNVEGSFPIP